MTGPGKRSTVKGGTEPRSAALKEDTLPLGQLGAFKYVRDYNSYAVTY